jgi:class 3 adenylate cyclase
VTQADQHELPLGTVTFLFTDVEASTQLVRMLGDAWTEVLEQHRLILRKVFAEHGGAEVDTSGDSFFIAFSRASDAIRAALDAQQRLSHEEWPSGASIRIRMGLHTGEVARTSQGYAGLSVHEAARIANAAHGGQVLVSQIARDLIGARRPEGASLTDLGQFQLKDFPEPQHLYQLLHDSLPDAFPPLRAAPVEVRKKRGFLPRVGLVTMAAVVAMLGGAMLIERDAPKERQPQPLTGQGLGATRRVSDESFR